jgi:hypothetical protein
MKINKRLEELERKMSVKDYKFVTVIYNSCDPLKYNGRVFSSHEELIEYGKGIGETIFPICFACDDES